MSKGALVVMKAIKTGSLYKLEGSIQVNEATVVFEEETKSTHLWHQQLGHMSEKGKISEFEFLQTLYIWKTK